MSEEKKTDSEIVKRILADQSTMETERSTWEAHWQEVAERIMPRGADFLSDDVREGEKKTEKILDSTPVMALERFGAAMESTITPRTQKWHGLTIQRYKDNGEVKRYLEEVTNILFSLRYAPLANFANQIHEVYMSIGGFGNGCLFTDELPGKGMRYIAYHLREIFYTENYQGLPDLIHRKFKLTARQAAQQFGVENLPRHIADAYERNPLKKFEFIHRVEPNPNIIRAAKDYRGMPLLSYYISKTGEDNKRIVERSGYWSQPYAIGRYYKQAGETYGRGPGMTALPEMKSLNAMTKETIAGAQLSNRPPLLATDDGVLDNISLSPAAVIPGGITDQGHQAVQPLQLGSQPQVGLTFIEQKREIINDIFLVTLFQILVQNPQMTATEAMLRAQEKGQLLAPTMGRVMSEMLGPIIERELDICARNGLLPEPPQIILDDIEANGGSFDVDITYTSPLIRLQRAEEATGISQTFQFAGAIAQTDPSIMQLFNGGEALRIIADTQGCPAKIIATREEQAAIEKADAEAQKQQRDMSNLLAAAPVISSAAKNIAEAEQRANTPYPTTR